MLNKPGSCFLDALELGLGMPSDVVGAFIRHHFPHCDCDNLGYHSSLVNLAALELFRIGVSQIDACPVGYGKDGEPFHRDEPQKVSEYISKWFGRPGFRCVVTGPATYGTNEEHANAWNGQCWLDPIKPTEPLEAPTVKIRSLWVTTVPPQPRAEPESESEAESQEDDDVDQT